jgi:hypothetical protein
MSTREAQVELLLGRVVHDAEGKRLGRLEELRAVQHQGELRVSQFLVGRYGVAARLSSASLRRALLQLAGSGRQHSGYLIPWSWMDLSDPLHPRCTHPARDLSLISADERAYREASDVIPAGHPRLGEEE